MWNSDSQGLILEYPRPSISGGQTESTPRVPTPRISAQAIIALRDSGKKKSVVLEQVKPTK